MCGICGYIGPKKVNEEQLWKMNNLMYHRGPNDAGIWQYHKDDLEIGLGQRRLSILDLSSCGHQPMYSEDGRYVIVYNGEVYNFQEIRRQLEKKEYSFRSNCDTEIILYAYIEWKERCFLHFNGMFAIAIYDKEQNKLILARDHIGKKPLYYYFNKDHFVFASELKPIMEYPYFEKKIDEDVIANYLCNKYLVSPLCIFKNTYKMIPGTILEYHNNEISVKRYWDVLKKYEERVLCREEDFSICKKKISKLITDAISSRLIADVPIGTFLSGGIDSTVVTAIAQGIVDKPIDTYSIGFFDKDRDEALFSAEIARYLGTKHHEHYVSENDIFKLIEDLPYYYDEPFADSSQLPTMLVSQYASQDITVALSGDGGDEVFCGYNMYDLVWIAQHVDFCGELANKIPGMDIFKGKFPSELRAMINNRDKETKTQLFTDVILEEANKLLGKHSEGAKLIHEKKLAMKNWQERRMLLDILTYLPDEILAKTDRASMKYSLEVRCPLLDHRIIEESFRIPHKYKYHRFEKKYILKNIAYDYVPKNLLDRPKKGFGVPLKKWLRNELKQEIFRYSEEKALKKQDIFEAQAVKNLICKQEKSDKIIYSSILWSYYIFQKWYQRYIEDLW